MDEHINNKISIKLGAEFITEEQKADTELQEQFDKARFNKDQLLNDLNNTGGNDVQDKIIENDTEVPQEKINTKEEKIKPDTREVFINSQGKELVKTNNESGMAVYEEKLNKNELRDEEYIIGETHQTIGGIAQVMNMWKDQLKEGSRASEIEAFASLARTMNESLKNLGEFHMKVQDRNIINDPEPEATTNITNNFIGNGSDMLDRVIELQQQAKLDKTKEVKQVLDKDK